MNRSTSSARARSEKSLSPRRRGWEPVFGEIERKSKELERDSRVQLKSSRSWPALYTPEERRRRDASPWTLVQGVLAPLQFAVFLVSLVLVLRYLATGSGFYAATVSIVVKTFVLYTIMVTGSIWEKAVFGRWLFAPAFFWEDVVSMAVIALHTAYLAALVWRLSSPESQMLLALAAYAAYAVNAMQFLLKLRAARRQAPRIPAGARAFAEAGA